MLNCKKGKKGNPSKRKDFLRDLKKGNGQVYLSLGLSRNISTMSTGGGLVSSSK